MSPLAQGLLLSPLFSFEPPRSFFTTFLKADQRSFNRYMFGRAAEAEIDSIGRILIPDFLKDRINLKNSAAIIGVGDRVEIWNDKTWSQNQEAVAKQAGDLAEKLGNGKSL